MTPPPHAAGRDDEARGPARNHAGPAGSARWTTVGGVGKGEGKAREEGTAAQEALPKREGPLGSEPVDEPTKVRPKAR